MEKLLENSRKDYVKATAQGLYQTWADSPSYAGMA